MRRRDAIAMLGAGALAARQLNALPAGLTASGIDHVQLAVADPVKSAAFYARVFGYPVWKNKQSARRYIQLGPSYLVLDAGQAVGRVDHFSTGIQGFDIAKLHAYLEQIGVPYRDFPSGRDTSVTDPDGTRLELSAENSWKQLTMGTAVIDPDSPSGDSIVKPLGFWDIVVNVSDLDKAAAFYEDVFFPRLPAGYSRGAIKEPFEIALGDRPRIVLQKTPAGEKLGVSRIRVNAASKHNRGEPAESFEYPRLVKELEQAGAKIESGEPYFPLFRDPDGILIELAQRRDML